MRSYEANDFWRCGFGEEADFGVNKCFYIDMKAWLKSRSVYSPDVMVSEKRLNAARNRFRNVVK